MEWTQNASENTLQPVWCESDENWASCACFCVAGGVNIPLNSRPCIARQRVQARWASSKRRSYRLDDFSPNWAKFVKFSQLLMHEKLPLVRLNGIIQKMWISKSPLTPKKCKIVFAESAILVILKNGCVIFVFFETQEQMSMHILLIPDTVVRFQAKNSV